MQYEVELATSNESLTAVVTAATTWEQFPKLWKGMLDQAWAYLRDNDLRTDGHNVMLYKDDVPNVEVGVQVRRPFMATGRVVPSRLPGGRVARTVHQGPYEGLNEPHRAVREWCAARGLALAGPRWEIYGDWHDDPAQLETEVCYLLV